jgi:CheY-like chemotaxis protein
MLSYKNTEKARASLPGVESRRQGPQVPKILVADDNTNIQRMVTLALQERGIEVTSVGNGEAAVRRIPDLLPDLVLADIFMPVRNGYEVCEWIKTDQKFAQIPVILLIGAFDPLDEKEARRVGADGVLKKPFIPPDPLIAMVTSVLEKNPKIAAEMRKPKEPNAAATPAPPAPPAPVAAQPPAKIQPAPQPEFPEPSPEEAALVYAFGTARRALDDDDVEPAAPKAEVDDGAEEFDGASTTSDWRRSAMDFEVPEETASRPAFSGIEDLESQFPSERKIAPQAVNVADVAAVIENAPQEVSGEHTEAASQPISSAEVSVIEETAEIAESGLQNKNAAEEPLVADEPVSIEAVSDIEISAPAPEDTEPVCETSTAQTQAAPEPEPSFASKAPHWMDMMASPSELPKRDWFASTVQPKSSSETTEARLPVPSHVEEPAPSTEVSAAEEAIAQDGVNEFAQAGVEQEPFFADELEAETKDGVEAAQLVSETAAPEISGETASESAEQAVEISVEQEQEAPTVESSVASETGSEVVPEPEDEVPAFRELELVEPPAVHVRPEPLLVREDETPSLKYGVRQEEVPAAYSFLSPAKPASEEDEPASGEPRIEQSATSEPVAEESVQERPAPRHFFEQQEIEHSELEFSSAEFEQQVPAVPEPDGEALEEIPYLNLPSNFSKHAEERSAVQSEAADSAGVDAVVDRVLLKLEPQLRELFRQSVLKPLVENILHSEYEKKEP